MLPVRSHRAEQRTIREIDCTYAGNLYTVGQLYGLFKIKSLVPGDVTGKITGIRKTDLLLAGIDGYTIDISLKLPGKHLRSVPVLRNGRTDIRL